MEGIWVFIVPLLAALLGYMLSKYSNTQYGFDKEERKKLDNKLYTLEDEVKLLKEQNLLYERKINKLISLQQDNTRVVSDHLEQDLVSKPTSEEAITDVLQKGQTQKSESNSVDKKVSKYESLKHDNLQIIEGIGPKMESVLKENGIDNWQTLSTQTDNDLHDILGKYGKRYKIIDPSSWAQQANLAASGSWNQLTAMQKGLYADQESGDRVELTPKVEKVMIKLGIIKEYKLDDLKAIEGIGPKIAELLNNSNINSWKQLAETNVTTLQSILDKAGKRYQLADPSTWAKQAALAQAGRFDELTDYQETLQGGL